MGVWVCRLALHRARRLALVKRIAEIPPSIGFRGKLAFWRELEFLVCGTLTRARIVDIVFFHFGLLFIQRSVERKK